MLFDVLLTVSDVIETKPIDGNTPHWRSRLSSVMDSSHLSTFLIALALIIYGSFRALEQDKCKDSSAHYQHLSDGTSTKPMSNSHVIETMHAIALPLGASFSLIIMFFFFDSLQTIFILCTAILATMGFAFLLTPCCQILLRPWKENSKISFGVFGRYPLAEIVAFLLSLSLVLVWIVTGHWFLMDVIATGLCISFIALVRLPNLKVSALLLLGLVIYDVFWVYFSQYIFATNVMVRVATREAENPLNALAKKLNFHRYRAPRLSLPGKIVFPSLHQQGRFSLLGLGDIIMPGLVLCFVLRFESRKRAMAAYSTDPLSLFQRLTYFQCSLFGYCAGLLAATVSSEVFKCAQPALLFLVPFTLIPLLCIAHLKGDLNSMWSDPFNENSNHSSLSPTSSSCKLLDV